MGKSVCLHVVKFLALRLVEGGDVLSLTIFQMFSLVVTEDVVLIQIWTVDDSQGEVKTAEDHFGFTTATFHLPVLTAC